MKQTNWLKKEKSAYGGELLKTRKGRSSGRPLATRHTMHLVLRSTKAKGALSFKTAKNAKAIGGIVGKFSKRFGVQVIQLANVGNHLHFHIRLSSRYTFKPFIRAISSAIAMAVTGRSRWNAGRVKEKFWDYRPFTRIVDGGLRAFLTVRDYLRLNQLEGFGFNREVARIVVREEYRGSG